MPYPENILQPPDLQVAMGTPSAPQPDPLAAVQGLIEAMSQANQAPLFPTPEARFSAGLTGLGAGLQGQANPAVTQALAQRQQDMSMLETQMRSRLTLEGLRSQLSQRELEKTKVLLSIAKDLPDDNPAALKKKLSIYTQSGLVTYSPEEIDQQILAQQAKQIPGLVGAVIGAIDAGMDPNLLPPALRAGVNVDLIKSLPPDVRRSLDPEGRKKLKDALKADLAVQADQLALDRKRRMSEGKASPLDFLAEGAKDPAELGAKLVANSLATGVPILPEHQPFVQAYQRHQEEQGAKKEVLAVRAAMGDPIAAQALKILQSAEEGKKTVGEASDPYLNDAGDAAPPAMTTTDAIHKGYFRADAREIVSVSAYPQAIQTIRNIADTLREVRDLGGFRTQSGIGGAFQRMVKIPAQRFAGDPLGISGKLNLLEGQKTELIQVLRTLGEKGNIPAKVLVPQLSAVSPEAGMLSSMEMLKKIEAQLVAGIKQTRLAKLADRVSGLPEMLLANSPEYQALVKRGWTDAMIETGEGAPDGKPLTLHGRPIIVVK